MHLCTIPLIRGTLPQPAVNTLLTEAQALAAAGVRELNLVAQDTTAYGPGSGGPSGVAGSPWGVGRRPGSLGGSGCLYGHPARLTPALLEIMAADPQTVPYLDLPIQHGHDEMFQRMGRGYSRQRACLDTVRLIREILPGATLRTTVMVGFPGENEAHFEALQELMEEVRFDHLGVFLLQP